MRLRCVALSPRLDRLVEFEGEVWPDCKTGASSDPAAYRAQMDEYRSALQAVITLGQSGYCFLRLAALEPGDVLKQCC